MMVCAVDFRRCETRSSVISNQILQHLNRSQYVSKIRSGRMLALKSVAQKQHQFCSAFWVMLIPFPRGFVFIAYSVNTGPSLI